MRLLRHQSQLNMTKYFILLVLLVSGLWFLNTQTEHTSKHATLKLNADTVQAVNACDMITEKAAANLVAVVEFQKLEIAGRKAAVFKTCMADHGFKENPAWTKYAAPMAAETAKNSHVSLDEALENLRRTQMISVVANKNQPTFWTLAK